MTVFIVNSATPRKLRRKFNCFISLPIWIDIEFKKDKGLHPTQKPVDLLKYLILTYSNKGDTILDSCMGSGSTGIACIHTDRNFIGIEQEESFLNLSKNRYLSLSEEKRQNLKKKIKHLNND